MRLHHVQVACPRGGEDAVRAFYAGALGLTEVGKPEALRARGGAWFRSYDATGAVTAELHVGVEEPFSPARKAHPAFELDDLVTLEATAARIESMGCALDRSERDTFEGHVRFHARDPHGNRVELVVRDRESAEPARNPGGDRPVVCATRGPLGARDTSRADRSGREGLGQWLVRRTEPRSSTGSSVLRASWPACSG